MQDLLKMPIQNNPLSLLICYNSIMEHMLHFQELDSTNTYLKKHYANLPEKTVVSATRQTAGRGRLTRSWLSEPGGLYFSVLLKPHKIDFLPNLTQLMALCVCATVRELGANAWLKWPNDVLANGQKLCGILSEAVTDKNGFQVLVLGVGLNVNQTDLSQAGQPAASLKTLGINADTQKVLQQILDVFFEKYTDVVNNGFEVLRTEYLAHFPYIGKEVSVLNGAQKIKGEVQTISPEGKLVLQTPQGLKEISIGDMMV